MTHRTLAESAQAAGMDRAEAIAHECKMQACVVADAMSDLAAIKKRWDEGEKDDAFHQLLFYVGNLVRRDPEMRAYIDGKEVDDEGNIDESVTQQRVARKLWYEGLGPRPQRG